MANELTGDFEVVAQFTVPAANRVLAAMHRRERFPHSLSIRVDPPRELVPDEARVPSIVGMLTGKGQAVADPRVLVDATERVSKFYAPAAGTSFLDQPVNVATSPVFDREELTPIAVSGVAQVQLSPPTLENPDAETRITLTNRIMVRYFGKGNSKKLPEFLRGVVRTAVDVDRVASQVGDVIDVNLKASNTKVDFALANDVAASDDQKTAIQKAIERAVTTSFQPSNIRLPAGRYIQLKTLPGGLPAICVLVGMSDASGDPGSVGTVFLGGGDHFAFAVGRDFLVAEFKRQIEEALTLRGLRTFNHRFLRRVFGFTVADITWTISIDDVTVELADGEIRLTLQGRGVTQVSRYNFSFRAHQAFTLKLEGDTASLEAKGDIGLEVPSEGGLTGLMIDVFKGQAVQPLREKRDLAVDQAQADVRQMLRAQANLGGFLSSLINPPSANGQPAAGDLQPELAYTSFAIKASGLILHGELAVPPWPSAHVEFEASGANEYSALNTWIPGGTIHRYVWRRHNDAPLQPDEKTFVYAGSPALQTSPFENSPAALAAMEVAGRPAQAAPTFSFSSICLTVEGKRLSASGPVAEEDVRATRCAWPAVSLTMVTDPPAVGVQAAPAAAQAGGTGDGRRFPDMALTQIAASGALEVVGHASPWARARTPGANSPNLIVHFPDERSAGDLGFLTSAVRQGGRTDAATAIVAVLSREALARARPPEGVIVTDDPDGAWKDLFAVERPPFTVLVDPSGRIAWRHDGEPTIERLAPALREHLVAGRTVVPRVLDSQLSVGQPAPNFVFTYARGRELTLRKLIGRPVVLVFWKATSEPSVDTLRHLDAGQGKDDRERPVVLAVHEGDLPVDTARLSDKGAAPAIMVPDPEGLISRGYGISVWPTTVFIDAFGRVSEVRYGRPSRGQSGYGAESRRAD